MGKRNTYFDKVTLLINGELRNQIQVSSIAKFSFLISEVNHSSTSGSYKGSMENVSETMTSQRSPGMRCKLGFPVKNLAIVRTKAGWKGQKECGRGMGSGGGEGNVITDRDLGAIIW